MVSRHVVGVLALGGLAACAALTGLSDYEVVDPDAGAPFEGGSGPEGGPGASSSSGSGSDGSSPEGGASSGVVADPPASYVRELCAFRSRCLPKMFAALYPGGQAGCETRLREIEVQTGRTPTIAQYDACAGRLKAADCAQRETDFDECSLPGSAPDGAPCVSSSRCASRRCKQAKASDDCGVCAPPSGENGDCLELSDCAFGLWCNGNRCAKAFAEGVNCNETSPGACARGLRCVSSKCRKGVTVGQPCSTNGSAECRSELVCNQSKCEEFSWATVGARCGYQGQAWTACIRMACVSNQCQELRSIGESCASDGTQPYCDSSGLCAHTGKCIPIDGSSCPK